LLCSPDRARVARAPRSRRTVQVLFGAPSRTIMRRMRMVATTDDR
jgi:hypothetical protein